MFNLASSLLYNSLFQQNNNGEFEHKGSSAIKPPTYTMGLKAIPDDVVWALSAINLDQYELPEWRSGFKIDIFSYLANLLTFIPAREKKSSYFYISSVTIKRRHIYSVIKLIVNFDERILRWQKRALILAWYGSIISLNSWTIPNRLGRPVRQWLKNSAFQSAS